MKKRGQFFLIAALLISGIAIGFSTLYNSAYVERADTQVYDLSEELYAELQQTYDSGTVRGDNQEVIQANLKQLAEYYQSQNPDSTFVIFYGDPDSESCKKRKECIQRIDTSPSETYNEEPTTDTSSETPSSTGTRGTQAENTRPSDITPSLEEAGKEKKVKVRVRFKTHPSSSAGQSPDARGSTPITLEEVVESPPFELKPGQNFYFVIRKKVKNEQVVVYRK